MLNNIQNHVLPAGEHVLLQSVRLFTEGIIVCRTSITSLMHKCYIYISNEPSTNSRNRGSVSVHLGYSVAAW